MAMAGLRAARVRERGRSRLVGVRERGRSMAPGDWGDNRGRWGEYTRVTSNTGCWTAGGD